MNFALGSADAVIVRRQKTELTVRKRWNRMAGYSYRLRSEFVAILRVRRSDEVREGVMFVLREAVV